MKRFAGQGRVISSRTGLLTVALLLISLCLSACGDATATPATAATTVATTTAATTTSAATTVATTTAAVTTAAATTVAGTTAATTTSAASNANLTGTIRIGYFPNETHPQALIGLANGTFQKALGPNVKLVATSFNAGPAATEALLAGQIDLSYLGPNPAINAYVKTNGAGVRIIAGAASGGVEFIVRADETINGPKDLAGKKLASPQLGNTQDVALRSYLNKNGLKTTEQGGDVQVVPSDNATILQLFKNKQIDGAWVPEPYASRLITEDGGKILVDEKDLWPNGQFVITNILVSTSFLTQHPDLVKAFLEAHVDLTQQIQKDPTTAKQVINTQLKALGGSSLAPAVLDQSFGRIQVLVDPLKSSLLTSADNAFNLGFLGKTKPNLDNIYDLTILNQVLTEKGLPPIS